MNLRVKYYFSEFIGTFAMMFIGISAIVFNFGTQTMQEAIPSPSIRLLLTGFLFAGGVTLVVYSPVGRISGAHLNPAVSFAFLLEKKIGVVDFAVFSFVQILASIIAAFMALLAWSDDALKANVGMTKPTWA
jgi:aquaporin Z